MKTKTATKTQFELAKEAVYAEKIKAPSVSVGTRNVPYFRYQLAVHKFNLSIMSSGMTCRGVKLKDLKNYYGLKGKTAKECLPQFLEIMEAYEKEFIQSN